jgi:hypothetical protein
MSQGELDPPQGQSGSSLTNELWSEICRKTELAIKLSEGRLSSAEKEASDWVLSRKHLNYDSILNEVAGTGQLKVTIEKLRFLIGDPWQ